MTGEEAIKIFSPKTCRETMMELMGGIWDHSQFLVLMAEAQEMALAALRTQQAQLDRSRWWCAHCNDMAAKQSMIMHGENYCCNCGRPLTEEAWAELERRVE